MFNVTLDHQGSAITPNDVFVMYNAQEIYMHHSDLLANSFITLWACEGTTGYQFWSK